MVIIRGRTVEVFNCQLCEQLEQSIVEVCKVVKLKKRPFRTEDYSLKLRPVWYTQGTGSSVIERPYQLAIDTISGNIFVVGRDADKILVLIKQDTTSITY